MGRGWAEQEPRICIPVPAVPVQDIWQVKTRKICYSLNWFKGVTFTFCIKKKISSLKSIQRFTNYPVFFLPEVPIPALPEPESKFLVPSLLAPYREEKRKRATLLLLLHCTRYFISNSILCFLCELFAVWVLEMLWKCIFGNRLCSI